MHLPRSLPELERPDTPTADEFGGVKIVRRGKFLNQAEVAVAVMRKEAISEQFELLTGETGFCLQALDLQQNIGAGVGTQTYASVS